MINRDYGKTKSAPQGYAKARRMKDGGTVSEEGYKSAGLQASNKEEPVGLLARLKMGNIDDAGSEAYNRFGAGRGRNDAAYSDSSRGKDVVASKPAADPKPAAAEPAASTAGMDESDARESARAETSTRSIESPKTAAVKSAPSLEKRQAIHSKSSRGVTPFKAQPATPAPTNLGANTFGSKEPMPEGALEQLKYVFQGKNYSSKPTPKRGYMSGK
jgi:hypothetical protein